MRETFLPLPSFPPLPSPPPSCLLDDAVEEIVQQFAIVHTAATAAMGTPFSVLRTASRVAPGSQLAAGTPLTTPHYYTRLQRKKYRGMGLDLEELPPGHEVMLDEDGSVLVVVPQTRLFQEAETSIVAEQTTKPGICSGEMPESTAEASTRSHHDLGVETTVGIPPQQVVDSQKERDWVLGHGQTSCEDADPASVSYDQLEDRLEGQVLHTLRVTKREREEKEKTDLEQGPKHRRTTKVNCDPRHQQQTAASKRRYKYYLACTSVDVAMMETVKVSSERNVPMKSACCRFCAL